MSLTLPTAFENARRHRSSGACFILAMQVKSFKYGGSAAFVYLSTRSFSLPDSSISKVENAVLSFSPISQGVDFYSHAYKMNSCIVSLSSNWTSVNSDDGSMYSYADMVGDGEAFGSNASIYLYPGGSATALTDCLLLLVGKVTQATAGSGSIELKIDELDRWAHRDLPQTRATKADYPNIPPSNDGTTIGLCYGEYTDVSSWGADTLSDRDWKYGQAQGLLVDAGETYTYLLTKGECIQVGQPSIYIDALKSWSSMHDYSSDSSTGLDANGNMYISFTPQTTEWNVGLYPTSGYGSSSATTNVMNVSDMDDDSSCGVYASAANYGDIILLWHQNGSSDNDALYNSLASISSVSPVVGIRKANTVATTTKAVDIWNGSSWVQVSALNATDLSLIEYDISPAFDWTGSNGIFWHLGTGPNNGDGKPTAIRIRFENSGSPWTAGVTKLSDIIEVYISIRHAWPRPVPSEKIRIGGPSERARRRGSLNIGANGDTRRGTEPESIRSNAGGMVSSGPRDNVDGLVCNVQGIIYPSPGWGDNHSDPGSSIEDVPGIIEHILRTELGISDIDVPSFQAVNLYHYGYPIGHCNLPHGSSIYSKQLIETLCWENGIFLIRSRDGDVKMFDYEVLLGDLGTILPFDLVNGLPIIHTTDSNDMYNDVSLEWGANEWNNGYMKRVENATDSTSVSRIGKKHKDISLTFMRSDDETGHLLGDPDDRHPTDRLLDRLIGAGINNSKTNPEYLMSRPHALVELHTIGHKFAHAEPGDYFALDSTTFDPVLKCWGESWSGKSFMVYETEVHEDKVVIKGLNWQPMPIS